MVSTCVLVAVLALSAWAADDSKVKAATKAVESGAKKIGEGQVGEGVEETARGIGKTIVEGAKLTGEKVKEAGKAAEQSVRSFFSRLFGSP